MTLVVTADDLGTYLGDSSIDEARADLMIELASDLAGTVVSPLPDEAKAVVLSVAARGYLNPQGNTSETVGAWSGSGMGGIFLMSGERRDLKTMAGRGGAFTVDPTPADAGSTLPTWDINVFWPSGEPLLDEPVE